MAESGKEAIGLLESRKETVQLLLTDVVMPDMNGRELYAELVRKHPRLKVLYMSGYTDNVIIHHGILDDGVQFIQKPFTTHSIVSKVREVINS